MLKKVAETSLLKAVELIQLYLEDQLSNGRFEIAPVPLLSGNPGIGKSAMITQLATRLRTKDNRKIMIKTIHPALKPLEMFSGIPEIVRKEHEHELVTRWTKPEIVDLQSKEDEILIWFWDDIHLLDQSQAKYCFELLTYRKLHDYEIPENTVFVWAGNHSFQSLIGT